MMHNKIEELILNIKLELEIEYPFLQKWKISFDNAKRRAGICKISSKVISISRSHIQNNEIEVIKDTILHEFAHAIAYELYKESGHGHQWKRVAKEIGAMPKACGSFNLSKAPWLLVHACSKTLEIEPISQRFRLNKRIKNYFLSGRPETKGELFFIKQTEFNEFKQGLLDKSRLVLIQ